MLPPRFLSTLSLRRATRRHKKHLISQIISIHALLAESDQVFAVHVQATVQFLSTLSLRRATHHVCQSPCCGRFLSTLSLRRATWSTTKLEYNPIISIHALLAESDLDGLKRKLNQHRFLSTLSLRRATTNQTNTKNLPRRFLSTLSLRRATKAIKIRINLIDNFYPRSPCGERLLWVLRKVPILDFYPRSPCGERPSGGGRTGSGSYFYPRSPYGERHDFRG